MEARGRQAATQVAHCSIERARRFQRSRSRSRFVRDSLEGHAHFSRDVFLPFILTQRFCSASGSRLVTVALAAATLRLAFIT